MADKNNFPIAPAPFAPPSCGPCPPPPGGPCPPRPPFPRPVIPGTSQYIGARYVPKFADPIEWSKDRDYEQLEIVTTPSGDSYTSRCPVPVGVDISNTRYWAKTSSQSVQVEQYRQEVADLSKQVTDNNQAVDAMGGKIDGWQQTMDGWAGQVDQWEQTVGQASQEIAELQANDSRQDATLNQHTQSIAEIQAKDTAQDTSIKANADAIKAAQDTQVAFEAAYEQDKAALQAADAQNAAAIARTDVAIKQNTKNIQDNAANIAQNAAEIAKHGETLTQYAGKFATLDNKDKEQDAKMDGIRADLTEAEANIQLNADAISHLQQDGANLTTAIGKINDKNAQQDIAIQTAATAAQDAKNTAQAAQAAADGVATTAAQANATAQAANATAQAAKTTADKAAEDVKSIIETGGGWQESRVKDLETNQGAWTTDHPGKSISQAVTENANAAKSAADAAKAADTKATQANNAAQAAQSAAEAADTKATAAQAAAAAADAKAVAAQTSANAAKTAADQAKTAADAAKTDASDALAQALTAEQTAQSAATDAANAEALAQRAEQKAESISNQTIIATYAHVTVNPAGSTQFYSVAPILNFPTSGSKLFSTFNFVGTSPSGTNPIIYYTTASNVNIKISQTGSATKPYIYVATGSIPDEFLSGLVLSFTLTPATQSEIEAYEAEQAAYQAAKEKAITDSGWLNGPAPAEATYVYGPFDQAGLEAYQGNYGMAPHMLVVAYPQEYSTGKWYIRSTKEIANPSTDIGYDTNNTIYVTNEDNTAYCDVV